MGSLIRWTNVLLLKCWPFRSQSSTNINIAGNNNVFSGKLTHTAPLFIILVKSTMVQNIGTNNIGQDKYTILLNFNTGSVHRSAHNWCYGAVSNGLTVGISHKEIFSNLKNYIHTCILQWQPKELPELTVSNDGILSSASRVSHSNSIFYLFLKKP